MCRMTAQCWLTCKTVQKSLPEIGGECAPKRARQCRIVLCGFRWRFTSCPNTCMPSVQQTAHRFRIPRFAVQGHIDFVQRSCYLEIERSSNGLNRRVMPGYWGISGSVVCLVAEPKPGSCPKCSRRIALALCLRDQRSSTGHFGHHHFFFTSRTLSSNSTTQARSPANANAENGVCGSVHDSLLDGGCKVDSLPDALPDFLEPRSRIGTVNHTPQKAQPFGGVIAVASDVVLRDLGVQSEKGLRAPRLGEDVSRVAKLRGFDDYAFLN